MKNDIEHESSRGWLAVLNDNEPVEVSKKERVLPLRNVRLTITAKNIESVRFVATILKRMSAQMRPLLTS